MSDEGLGGVNRTWVMGLSVTQGQSGEKGDDMRSRWRDPQGWLLILALLGGLVLMFVKNWYA